MNDMENDEMMVAEEVIAAEEVMVAERVIATEEVMPDVEIAEQEAVVEMAEADNGCETETGCETEAEIGDDDPTEVVEEESVDIEALIAEAEARGYERGRNEGIEGWMNEGRRGRVAAPVPAAESEVMILNNMRRSVWE